MKARCFKILGIIAIIIALISGIIIFTKIGNYSDISSFILFIALGIILLCVYFYLTKIKKEKDTCIIKKKKK